MHGLAANWRHIFVRQINDNAFPDTKMICSKLQMLISTAYFLKFRVENVFSKSSVFTKNV